MNALRTSLAATMFALSLGCGAAATSGVTPPAPESGPHAEANGIAVRSATYGRNCGGSLGNATSQLASACNGRAQCAYAVQQNVLGDPAYGCAKSYEAEYVCAGDSTPRRVTAAAEAGSGSEVTLDCSSEWSPVTIVSATYGRNCGVPEGNVTAHLKAACEGARDCRYAVQQQLIGDPASGCPKAYDVTYSCPGEQTTRTVSAPAEAGYGSVVTLSCH